MKEVSGGWQATVRWPSLRLFERGKVERSKAAARRSAKRLAFLGFLQTLERESLHDARIVHG